MDKFNHVFIMLPFAWLGPMQTLVALWLLWPILGASSLASLALLGLLVPLQFYLSRKFASLRLRIASYTDERVRLVAETIGSLRTIKLYAWERYFEAALRRVRKQETDLINRYVPLVSSGVTTQVAGHSQRGDS